MLENRPADDLYIGRFASEQGLETKLLPYVVQSVADFRSLGDLFAKRAYAAGDRAAPHAALGSGMSA